MNASKAQQKGQQRLLLVTGGVLVAIAASLLWYNKYSRTRRRQHRDDLIFNEAVDDDDDFNNEPDEELRRVFIEAAKVAKSFGGGVLDQRDQLMLYGLYKQATEGDRNDDDHKAVSFCIACLDIYNIILTCEHCYSSQRTHISIPHLLHQQIAIQNRRCCACKIQFMGEIQWVAKTICHAKVLWSCVSFCQRRWIGVQ